MQQYFAECIISFVNRAEGYVNGFYEGLYSVKSCTIEILMFTMLNYNKNFIEHHQKAMAK